MSLADLLANEARPAPKAKHPQGWNPSVEERGDHATAVSEPVPADGPTPDEATLITGWGMCPNEWEIVGPADGRLLARGTTDALREGWTPGDYEQLAALLDEALASLAADVASALARLPGS